MKELSLHILDVVENSISAQASNISISIVEDRAADRLQIVITDDGKGMDAATVARLTDPFYTSRTTRRVGLGLPLLKDAAEACNGSLEIHSAPGAGTKVSACFQASHIDRMPMGDLAGTMLGLLVGTPEIRWQIHYQQNGRIFELDSQEIAETLGEISWCEPAVMKWLRETIQEGICEIEHSLDK